MEEILANLTARLKSLELENESLKVESHEARDLVNRAILGNSLNEESSGSKEPKASLPEKFDGTRKKFRGFINQLELVFQLQASRYNTDRKKIAILGTLLTDNALAWYNPYLEKPHLYEDELASWPRIQGKTQGNFWRNKSRTSI
ncbi:hypothetical protein BASA81_009698 [Batrachochytrium salamandrivorans]|nr:hypothetical protein BASA81_009698 [Batrachochytrium salamandrivorans]